MTDDTDAKALHRRQFLRAMGAGASTLAVAAAAAPLGAVPAEAQTGGKPDPRRSRYKESEHVKTFYRVNRY